MLSNESWISYFAHAPVSLAIRELNRIAALTGFSSAYGIPLTRILDIGCGDGFWWKVLDVPRDRVHGIDISPREVALASKHIEARVFDISGGIPFPDRKFSLAVGNCSLEHVFLLNEALKNIRASLEEGGYFALFVPTPTWAFQGKTQAFLLKRFPRLAFVISGALNGFFMHWHLYHWGIWRNLLETHGFEVIETKGLGNRRAEFLFRLFLPTGYLAFLYKCVRGRYPAQDLPFLARLKYRVLRRVLPATEGLVQSPESEDAYEYFFICRRNDGAPRVLS